MQQDTEVFDVYVDDDGVEYVLVNGQRVDYDPDAFEEIEEDGGYADEPIETFDVYVDEEGGEFVIVDGERVYLDGEDFEVVEVDPDDPDFNPLAYDNVQAATDVANDLARAGGSIAREGIALADELKGAMDDINSALDLRSLLK